MSSLQQRPSSQASARRVSARSKRDGQVVENVLVPIWSVRNRSRISGRFVDHVAVPLAGHELILLRRRMHAVLNGRDLGLEPKQYLLLEHLAMRPGVTVSTPELADILGTDEGPVTSVRVREVVHAVRRSLGEQAKLWIRTVRGMGYRWEGTGNWSSTSA